MVQVLRILMSGAQAVLHSLRAPLARNRPLVTLRSPLVSCNYRSL
jgi:hypothetical protein